MPIFFSSKTGEFFQYVYERYCGGSYPTEWAIGHDFPTNLGYGVAVAVAVAGVGAGAVVAVAVAVTVTVTVVVVVVALTLTRRHKLSPWSQNRL